MLESSASRKQIEEDLAKRENNRAIAQLQEVIAWLGSDDRIQEDDFARLRDRRHPGTGDWILQHEKFVNWNNSLAKDPVLWVWGIPGSGELRITSQGLSRSQCPEEPGECYNLLQRNKP